MALHICLATAPLVCYKIVFTDSFRIWHMLLRFGATVKYIWFNNLKLGLKLFGQIRIHAITSSEKFNLFRNNGVLTISG